MSTSSATNFPATIAIVGCGLVGRCWAIVFGRAKCLVRMYDQDPVARASTTSMLSALLPQLAAKGMLGGLSSDSFMANITVCPSLEECLLGVTHVQECLPEDLDLKKRFFQELSAKIETDTITLASSTSNLTCSSWSQGLPENRRKQCIVAHPINPPHCIPLVEIVPAPWTCPDTTMRVMAHMRAVGQVPVLLKKEVIGFAVNRLQYALLEEAFSLVERGIMSPEDVDAVMSDGLGLRWSFLGPFETIDLNAPEGVRQYEMFYGQGMRSVLRDMKATRSDWTDLTIREIDAAMRRKYPVEAISAQRLRRDERLMALSLHKRQQEQQKSKL